MITDHMADTSQEDLLHVHVCVCGVCSRVCAFFFVFFFILSSILSFLQSLQPKTKIHCPFETRIDIFIYNEDYEKYKMKAF